MAITAFGAASNPSDNSSLAGPLASIVPPASMLAGDIVYLHGQYKGDVTLSMSELGGQLWYTEGNYKDSATIGVSAAVFWCRFNGTWSANPSVTVGAGTLALTLLMAVFRPTTGSNLWAVDRGGPLETTQFAAPGTPFTVSRSGQTTTQANTVSFAAFHTSDDNTWAVLTGVGWTEIGQVRNLQGNDQSSYTAYKIQTSAGATGNAGINQLTQGGDKGVTSIISFYEYAQTFKKNTFLNQSKQRASYY